MVILAIGRVGVVEKARRVVRRGARWRGRSAESMMDIRVNGDCCVRYKRRAAGQDFKWGEAGDSRRIDCWLLGDVDVESRRAPLAIHFGLDPALVLSWIS